MVLQYKSKPLNSMHYITANICAREVGVREQGGKHKYQQNRAEYPLPEG